MNRNSLLHAAFEGFWLRPRYEQIATIVGDVNEADNGFLEIFLNLGWTGIAILAFVIASGYGSVVAVFRR